MTPLIALLRFFTRHPTAANLLLVLIVAWGVGASFSIRSQYFPDVVSETITVSSSWSGVSATDIDQSLNTRIEAQVLTVDGVEEVLSDARTGTGRVIITFQPSWNMERAYNDVSAAVEAIVDLPEDADPIQVRRGGWRDRVADVIISGPTTPERLSLIADDLVARLFREGVTHTDVRGRAPAEILIDISDEALRRHGLTRAQVADAVRTIALPEPAGELQSLAVRLRTGTEQRTVGQIARLRLQPGPDLPDVVLGDIATVVAKRAEDVRTYYNGDNPAVSIRIDRGASGDTIGIQRILEQTAAELTPQLPPGVAIDLIRTEAGQITQRLDLLLDNGLIGLGLVLVLLFMFLSFRVAFWVAAGIPVALAAAVGMMLMTDQTLNMLSLFMLIVCLGIIVDDAIVVAEHADFRVRRLGEPPVRAAERAALRMAAPVFAAMVTTAIAFASLYVVSGRFGVFIVSIPFVVVTVLIASLLECFLILPHHMATSLRAQQRTSWLDRPSEVVNRGFDRIRRDLFRPAISVIMRLRYPVIAACILALAISLAAILNRDVPWRFFSAPEQNSFSGNIAMLPGATRSDTLKMVRELQRAVDVVGARLEEEHGRNPVIFALAEIGGSTGRGLSSGRSREPNQLGSIAVELIDADLRSYSTSAVLRAVQREVVAHPLADTVNFRSRRRGPQGDSLDISLYGAAPEALKAASIDLQERLSRFPEVSALEDDLAYDKLEQVLTLTPLGEALGVTLDQVNQALRERLNGIEAASYPDGLQTGRILVRAPPQDLRADFFDRTEIALEDGGWVTLSEVVDQTARFGFSSVRRENGIVRVKVSGDLSEDDYVVAEEISRVLAAEILPDLAARHGVTWLLGGLAEQERAFLQDALIGAIICVLGIYLALAWIFGSWARPSVIMLTVPFGLIGAVVGHAAWDLPMSIFSVIGLIGMGGIIVNDSIVLVTTIQDYARRLPLRQAVIDATADRLRPVLLTTLTTVIGMAPLLYETSRQALFLKPTVITLCYGLGFGMFLILIIVPAALMIQDDIFRMLRSARRALMPRAIRKAPIALGGVALCCIAVLSTTVGHALVFQGDSAAITVLGLSTTPSSPYVSREVLALALNLCIAVIGIVLVVSVALLSVVIFRQKPFRARG